jgi:hypothetical protein
MLTRTQLRRKQKLHSLQCYNMGAMQRQHHGAELDEMRMLYGSQEAAELVKSVAIHKADAAALGYPVHYSALSNVQAADARLKTRRTFLEHRRLHQRANVTKHDTSQVLHQIPDAGFPLDDPAILLAAKDFQYLRQIESCIPVLPDSHVCGPFVPFAGSSFKLNAHALPFYPEHIVSNMLEISDCGDDAKSSCYHEEYDFSEDDPKRSECWFHKLDGDDLEILYKFDPDVFDKINSFYEC